jgi:hypothetical protein
VLLSAFAGVVGPVRISGVMTLEAGDSHDEFFSVVRSHQRDARWPGSKVPDEYAGDSARRWWPQPATVSAAAMGLLLVVALTFLA